MSEQGSRRPLILAVTGIAATLAVFLAYNKYSRTPSAAASSLHRSGAIRRSRRRWRRGHAPRELNHNPTERALQNLRSRIGEATPYGTYTNQLLFTVEEENAEHGLFDLLPANLPQIYSILSQIRPMTDLEKDKLKFHISSLFVQNFLQEEFPSGWIIGEDVETLVPGLGTYGIDEDCVRMMVHYFDHGKPLIPDNWDVRDEAVSTGQNEQQSDGQVERSVTQQAIEALAGPRHDRSDDSSDGDDDGDDDDDESDPGGSQNMLDLLYHIAAEQAKREGFIHRDFECDSCAMKPIQGIRYRCANCYDYDLCEGCEAQQVHNKSHVFYKVRIPVPSRNQTRPVLPVWYPGQPNAFPSAMPSELQDRLVDRLGMDKTEMDASYEQFKCLAGEQIPIEDDPAGLGMAISRQNFDMFFTPSGADRPPLPNLIHDRIFAFYDFHNDGVITLDEYIIGIFTLIDKSRGARLKRMFKGYDLDGDGYVDRKDFLRMFRAYYALTKEIHKAMVPLQNELDDDIREVVQGSQPISAAFSGHYFVGHASRAGQDKEIDSNGDLVITEGPNGVLQNDSDMRGDRARAIGNAAVRNRTQTHPFRSFRQRPESDDDLLYLPFTSNHRDLSSVPFAEHIDDEELTGPDPTLHVYGWPPYQTPEREDIINALGVDIPVDDVTDPIDRSRVIYAQVQRLDEESDKILEDQRSEAVREMWKRRQFYLDEEEGMTRPPGYTEPDSSDDEAASIDEPSDPAPQTSSSSRRQSMRSRSSSKVRFDETALDTDHETRSNTSSRSIPVNERWGGFELSAPERDVGKDIMYQAIQQGFNELVDPLFKKSEDEAMQALATKPMRLKWATELDEYEAQLKKEAEDKMKALRQADWLRTQALFSNGIVNPQGHSPNGHTSKPGTEYDETDHIQIMFGDDRNKQPEPVSSRTPDPTSSPINTTNNNETITTTTTNNETSPDPTLPQNKPNDPAFTPTPPPPDPSTIPPSNTTKYTWLQHRRVDEEAHLRGGYGKLSYREFCRLMIKEVNPDYITDSPSGSDDLITSHTIPGRLKGRDPLTGLVDGAGTDNNDADDDDIDGADRMWSSNGDLGKMSWIGTWLELAQF